MTTARLTDRSGRPMTSHGRGQGGVLDEDASLPNVEPPSHVYRRVHIASAAGKATTESFTGHTQRAGLVCRPAACWASRPRSTRSMSLAIIATIRCCEATVIPAMWGVEMTRG